MAFIDLGDQFLNFSSRRQAADDERHFGFVVDNRQLVLDQLERLGIELLPGPFKDLLAGAIASRLSTTTGFSCARMSYRGMGIGDLQKTREAIDELKEKGMPRRD